MSKPILKVVVGSRNPVKINAVRSAINTYYPDHDIDCSGMDAASLVSDQPMTSQQTRDGAVNRLRYCQQQVSADFYAAIEGGVDNFEDGAATFAYVVIANHKQMSVGRSANLPLPSHVYQALSDGEELGPLMDKMFKTVNIKQKGGAIGLLTNGHSSREANYTQALILAMAPFAHSELFDA
ncbi:MAG: inosine/xanthosine triphosphatase [Psychrobium sp.]|nr:inosine/xanthosine triphosphatase [Psychrobium sp.]